MRPDHRSRGSVTTPPQIVGIDLGTSSVKVVVVEPSGGVTGTSSAHYPTLRPEPLFAEQNPDIWWQATITATRAALEAAGHPAVAAIGVTGQMHGTVLLDQQDQPVCPAIIWADGRSADAARQLTEEIGAERLVELAGSPVASGFQAATLRWLGAHQPDLLSRTRTVTTPGGYIRHRLTGEHSVDPSDASGTLLFDVRKRDWSTEILNATGTNREALPDVLPSSGIAGVLTSRAGEALGMQPGTPVATGGADAACAALGCGVTDPTSLLLTFSTGTQVLVPRFDVATDPLGRLHTFCSVLDPGAGSPGWYTMGATLTAGMALTWLSEQIFNLPPSAETMTKLVAEAETVPPGSRGLVFLPYLIGERTPHMDPNARGVFLGLSTTHGRAELVRATIEGIVFAAYDANLALRSLGGEPAQIYLAGGGARFQPWRQAIADTFGLPAVSLAGEDHTAIGAAILAGAAVGLHDPVAAATSWRTEAETTNPIDGNRALYQDLFGIFQRTYQALRSEMRYLAELAR